jgi:hypothetical protein
MSSAVSNIIPNPLSHKHEGSPHSLSTLSSSPACGSNFSPNQANFSQPNCGVAAATTSSSTNSNGNGYQLYGVSPTEGSTASGICSSNNGPMSNVENSLTGNIDNNSIKMKENDFYISDEQLMQMSNTNISNHDPSIPSTPAANITKEPLIEEDEDEEDSRYNLPPNHHQQMPPQHPMQMQIPPFDQITYAQKRLYPINPMTDRNIIGRLPYAYNRANIPIPYPIPEGMSPAAALNRSQVYPPMMPMHYMMHPRFMPHPQMGMMPPGPIPPGIMPPGMMQQMPAIPPQNPPPPQPKPKSRSRKQNNNNNNQQQQQQQQHVPPPMAMMPPSQFMKPPMDMMRASSSTMGPPDMSLHQNMKINGNTKQPIKRYQGQKVADAGRCEVCMTNITPHEQGVFCTALNQGCFKPYHLRCQGLTTDAYHVLGRYSHIEWVCKGCTANKLIWNVDS